MGKPHKPIILNVDDTAASRYLKSRSLRLAGLQVYEGCTGEEALRMVGELKPDVVLLDVRLPDMAVSRSAAESSGSATASVLIIRPQPHISRPAIASVGWKAAPTPI
jgi:CheY-like chemotaxis protein